MQSKRIVFGLAGQILAELVNKAVPLIILHIVVNRLGAESFGYAQFGITLVELAIPFVILGYSNLATVHIGACTGSDKDIGAIISETLCLRLVNATIVTIVLLAIVSASAHYSPYTPVVAALSFVLFTSAIEMHFVHVGTRRMVSLSAINIVVKILSLLGILLFVKGPADSILFALLSFGANGVIAIMTLAYNIRRFPMSMPEMSKLKERFRQSLPFALMYFWTASWLSADLVIAEYFHGKQGAAIYGANMRLAAAVLNLLNAIALVFFSEVVASRSKEELSKLINVATLAVLSLALPIAVGAWFTAEPILALMLNEEFAAYQQVFTFMFSSVVATALITIFGFHLLLFLQKAALQNIFMVLAIALLTVSAAIFESKYGLQGIAVGSFVGRSIAAICLLAIARRYLHSYWFADWGKVILATSVMAAALYACQPASLWLSLIVGIVVYGVIYTAMFRSKISHYRQLLKHN